MPPLPPYNFPSPGVYIQEEEANAPTIRAVPTSTTGFIGSCAKGRPLHPRAVDSWAAFVAYFGGLDGSAMPLAVQQYFANGGVRAVIVRLIADDAQVATSPRSVAPGLHLRARSAGAWGNLRVEIVQAQDRLDAIDIRVFTGEDGQGWVEAERLEGLSLQPGQDRFFGEVLRQDSAHVDLLWEPGARPALSLQDFNLEAPPGVAEGRPRATLTLVGGTDGTGADLLQLPAVLAALEALLGGEDLNLLVTPGLNEATIVNAVLARIEATHDEHPLFYIVDGPAEHASAVSPSEEEQGAAIRQIEAYRAQLRPSSHAALYAPWLVVPDPQSGAPGATRLCPPSGVVAGIFARSDADTGIWKAPAGANATVFGAQDVALTVSNAQQDALNPLGVNCIRRFDGFGIVLWGARTLAGTDQPPGHSVRSVSGASFLMEEDAVLPHIGRNMRPLPPAPLDERRAPPAPLEGQVAGPVSADGPRLDRCPLAAASDSEFRYVNTRRLADHLARSIVLGTRWVVFEANAAPLWAQVQAQVLAFLHQLFQAGAFAGSTPREAYFVRCDASNNNDQTMRAGELHIQVGFAALRPADFIVLDLKASAPIP